MKKLYRIIMDARNTDIKQICDELYKGAGNAGTMCSDFNGEAVIDYLRQWEGDCFWDDDLQEEEPRLVDNGTDQVHTKDGYTLIYNSTNGGVYMLYREANSDEREYYKNYIL